jgi:pSer/pThr/pTyr-binding forkhead associated (FHA) protein
MTDTTIGGYEWRWTCGECDDTNDLSGTCLVDNKTILNGEKEIRIRELKHGDIITCGNDNCNNSIQIMLE